jgi:iron complex outermembrane receptor protein
MFRTAGVGLLLLTSTSAADAADDLTQLSLEQLGDVQITSVSKAPEVLRAAPAAIYVITHEDIDRSGATTLAEALRLAPNIRITQLESGNYAAATRGFGGNQDVQSFPNKLLLLIDGRSVYSPLFSGIYLDTQDLVLADIERIEVISGPGATLWGANAVNGVINVITRPAYITEGSLADATIGPREQTLNVRYGRKLGDDLALRVYAKALQRDSMERGGVDAQDDWRKAQIGFRLDLTQTSGALTVQADAYRGDEQSAGPGKVGIDGANLLARWQKQTSYGDLQLQGYFDHVYRGAPAEGVPFTLATYDVEAQQALRLGSSHRLVLGAGFRLHDYRITNSATLLFEPPDRSLKQVNVFAQDTMSLLEDLSLTLGLKLERNDYSGWEPQPDLRLAWRMNDSMLLWGSVSRAVRSPTPLDADVIERVGGVDFLRGNPDFQSEKVLAYEVGYRGDLASKFSLSVSGYYNVYNDLRTVEPASNTAFLPLRWDNLIKGHTHGVMTWAKWQVTDWWRLSPGLAWLHKDLKFKSGASQLLSVAQAGNDPKSHMLVNSSMQFGPRRTLDINLRHVASLPDPALPAYTELSARMSWALSGAWEVALSGTSLLHARHREYPEPVGTSIRRSVAAEVRWKR